MKLFVEKDLTGLKAEALRRLDQAAEAARLRYLTAGSGKALAYEAKREEALRGLAIVQEGKTLDPVAFPWAAERAERLGLSLAQVLEEWAAAATLWRQVGIVIEAEAEKAKAAILAARIPAEIETAEEVNWP